MSRLVYVSVAIGLAMIGLLVLQMRGQGGKSVVVALEPGPSQPRVPPGEAGIDPAALSAAAEYAGKRNTRALVVARGGHIVFEQYWSGTTFDSEIDPGFAPVLVALGVGAAMNDRLIADLDAPLSRYLPDAKPEEAAISLRQYLGGDAPGRSQVESADLLAGMLERVSSQTWPSFVAERLWKPMEAGTIEFHSPRRQQVAGAGAACCVRARIGDWMRIGVMLAHDGVFQANQLTPPGYVNRMMQPANKGSPRGYFTRVDGDFAARDVAWLEGSDQQRLWVVPSLELAILRVGDEAPSAEGWDEATIPNDIIRGTSGWQPRAAGEGVDPKKFAPH